MSACPHAELMLQHRTLPALPLALEVVGTRASSVDVAPVAALDDDGAALLPAPLPAKKPRFILGAV